MSLATQASISLINNKGDINQTFKDLGQSQTIKQVVSAALTAGVMDKVGALDSFKDLKTSTSFGDKLTYNLVDTGGRALVSTTITSGDIESAIKQALVGTAVNTAAGYAASQIKGLESSYIAHKLAHALSGCVAAAIADAKCKDGAIGAAVGEMVADLVDKPGSNASKADWDRYSTNVNAVSQLAAGAVAAYT